MSVTVGDRAVRVVIRGVRVAAPSAIDARRLADEMPAALERELTRLRADAPSRLDRRARPVDRAAARITDAVAERLRSSP